MNHSKNVQEESWEGDVGEEQYFWFPFLDLTCSKLLIDIYVICSHLILFQLRAHRALSQCPIRFRFTIHNFFLDESMETQWSTVVLALCLRKNITISEIRSHEIYPLVSHRYWLSASCSSALFRECLSAYCQSKETSSTILKLYIYENLYLFT